MMDRADEVTVQVGIDTGADAEELDELASRLRRQLLELDVVSVERARAGEAPPGTRAIEGLAVGTLIAKFVASSGLLKAMVGTIQSWLSGQRGHTVKLTLGGDALEITGASSSEQERLINLWIDRHRTG